MRLIIDNLYFCLDTKKKELSASPIWISDDLEFWPEPTVRFIAIASLHTELIALSSTGQLHQWRWSDSEPYRHPEHAHIHHPKIMSLNLVNERITHLSATSIRCSVATESGKVATFLDEVLSSCASSKLEQTAQQYTEFQQDRVISLHTCELYTVARLESGALYWWGVLPFPQRKRMWDKYRQKVRKHRGTAVSSSSGNGVDGIVAGAQVIMKSCPMYQPGAIGFTVCGGVPKVGQLLNAAWNLTDVCRFKIISTAPEKKETATVANCKLSI